ncbi:MAG: BNR-4 repeat-containing protein [Pseudomonadota bacterium]
MVLKTHLSYMLVCLMLSYSVQAASSAINLSDSSGQQQLFMAPIIYDVNFQAEHDRSGYKLAIVPYPVSFSPDGRAYIRQKNGVYYINGEGKWDYVSFLGAIFNASGQRYSSVDMNFDSDHRIVFDKEGYAYTPAWAIYSWPKRHPFLMVKPPDSEQWKAYKLSPLGEPRMEWFSGANMLDSPPAVLIYEHGDKTISLVNVFRNQDKISISKPQEISRNVFSIARLGSGGSIVVRTGDWIHTVFAFDISPENKKGTPEVWARWSPQKNIQYSPQLLGMSPVFETHPDGHDYPVVVSDSQGRLHVILGAHSRPFQYLYTPRPADSNEVEWTDPVVVGNCNLTYPDLVCDSKDTLHLVARQNKYSEGMTLVYLKKEMGKEWTKPQKLIVGSPGNSISYLNCYHKLMKDTNDKLFLTYYVYFNYFTDAQLAGYKESYPEEKLIRGTSQGFGRYNYTGVRRKGPYLLVSEDRGNSWRMAVMDDFKTAN